MIHATVTGSPLQCFLYVGISTSSILARISAKSRSCFYPNQNWVGPNVWLSLTRLGISLRICVYVCTFWFFFYFSLCCLWIYFLILLLSFFTIVMVKVWLNTYFSCFRLLSILCAFGVNLFIQMCELLQAKFFSFVFAGFDITKLGQEAQIRWLKPVEVLYILQNHENFKITERPPQKPPSN